MFDLPSDLVLGENALVHPGVVVGERCRIEDGAIVGRIPVLAAFSSAPRARPGPAVLEDGATICAGAVVREL